MAKEEAKDEANTVRQAQHVAEGHPTLMGPLKQHAITIGGLESRQYGVRKNLHARGGTLCSPKIKRIKTETADLIVKVI